MTPATTSYPEHAAIRLQDIPWHTRFFHEVLGQPLSEVAGLVPWLKYASMPVFRVHLSL
jgi:hypothetical protein